MRIRFVREIRDRRGKKKKSAECAGEADGKNVFLVKIFVSVLTIFYGNAILTLSVKNILPQAGSSVLRAGKNGEKNEKNHE